jgi:NAD(P)-dependent dehydrogenase (short-subunit alcohol dehydrogenase family)
VEQNIPPESSMKLENKIAIITGAGSGMGRAASILFAKEGAKIAAIDINGDAAEDTAKRIKAEGGNAFALRADVSKAADTVAMVEETVKRFGAPNVLYNNAGIEGEGDFLAQLSEEAFDRVIAINLRGVWLGMKAALPPMIKNGGGVIINTASIAGMVAVKGAAHYCASKAGVLALTRVAAMEYGRYNIRVNAICPGAIDTPMVARINEASGASPNSGARTSFFGRVGKPEEIAKTALFLASDDSSFATGAPFIIDGGWTVT